MYWIIIGIIIVIISILVGIVTDEFESGVCTFLSLAGFSAILSLIIATISSNIVDNKRKSEIYPIYSITNISETNSKTKGIFILGTGGFSSDINQKQYYMFYEDSSYGLKLTKIEINDSIFIKQDSKNPYVEKTVYKSEEINKLSKRIIGSQSYYFYGKTIIHIPANSIIKQVNINLENF